jgi:hypothetical protein
LDLIVVEDDDEKDEAVVAVALMNFVLGLMAHDQF